MGEEDKMIITLDDLIVEFASNMSLGMRAIQAAAEAYVTAIAKYPKRARETFAARFRTIRRETWAILEHIGGRRLPPQAMMMASGAVQKMLEAKVPYRKLMDFAKSTVTVYNPKTGTYSTIPFAYLTEGQADILLNPVTHALRSKDQQRRYVERTAHAGDAAARKVVRSPGWVMTDAGLVCRSGVTIPVDELVAALRNGGYIA